jgi:TonB-linked SusC/RagA family outer membrane protein
MTGSVSSIKSNELKLLPTQRADQALQGRSAGVMVTNTDGAPGGNTSIRIRGMNSIQGGNNALIVIDGLQGANLNTIDPNDIESMEILKDASATAIYGSRGSNGVILITTKGGKKGKPSINYNGSFGFQTLAKKLDVLNAYDYATLVNENRMRDDLHSPIPIFSESQLADFKSGPSTNWQDEIYRVAKMQNHQLSMDGGTDKTTYYFSAGALLQDGILLNSGYKRYNIRGNINSQINDWIKAGLNVSVINTSGTVSPFGGQSNASFLSSAIILAPQWPATIPVRDAQGNYSIAPINNGPVGSWNPVASAMETSTLNYQIDNNANTYLEFSLLKGLKLKVTGSGNVITNNNRTYWDSKTYEGIPVGGLSGKGFVNQSRFEQYQNSNILTYDNEFGKHHLTFTGVVEEQTQSGTGNRIEAEQFAFDPNGLNDLSGAKIVRIATTSAYKRFLLSFLGRVNYTFAGKYLFTASMRRDGSSVFGSDHKWGNFPSVALGWKLSEESFIKSLSVISDLKLRASWGKTGNQGISPYQTLASIYSNPGGLNYPYDGTDNTTSIGYALSGPANPKLKWETTTQTNIGLDFGFFNNRLTGNIDLFNKVTTDLLMYRSLPGYTGFYGIIDNVGSVGNKGIELTLGGDPLSGAVQWHTGISVSLMKNEILDIGTDKEILSQSSGGGYGTGYMAYLKKGGSFGSWYGYKYLGTWKENERTQAAEFGKLPGDAKYQDTNGDGKVDIDDRVLIGNALPNVIYGWSNTVVYKDFAMSVLIQGVSGNNVFNTPRIRLEAPGSGTSTALLDKYSSTNQGSDIPAFQKASSYLPLSSAGKTDKYFIDALYTGATSRWVENGSYLRVKNITLAYNIPSNLTYKYGIKRSKIYVSGTNLFTLTKYKGYDPEVSSFNDSDGSIGIDFGNYPAPKTFTFGMELSF